MYFFHDFVLTLRTIVRPTVILGVAVSSAVLYAFMRQKMMPKTALNDCSGKVTFKLVRKIHLPTNLCYMRFAFPSRKQILGLPTCMYLMIAARIRNNVVFKPYFPVSLNDTEGHMDVLIKVYDDPEHMQCGEVSGYLNQLRLGNEIEVYGPVGRLKYLGYGWFSVTETFEMQPEVIKVNKVALIAGETGILAMIQLIRQILSDPLDTTEIRLVLADKTEDDILLRKDLEMLKSNHPEQFDIWFVLSDPPTNWTYGTGSVNEKVLDEYIFPPAPDVFVIMCGPKSFVSCDCSRALRKLGYESELCFTY